MNPTGWCRRCKRVANAYRWKRFKDGTVHIGRHCTGCRKDVGNARMEDLPPEWRERLRREMPGQQAGQPPATAPTVASGRVMPFGKHKWEPLDRVPVEYREWLLQQVWLKDDLRQAVEASLAGNVDAEFRRMFGAVQTPPPANQSAPKPRVETRPQSETHVPYTMPNGKVTLVLKEWVADLGHPDDVCPFEAA